MKKLTLVGLAVVVTVLGLSVSPLIQYQADAFKEGKMMEGKMMRAATYLNGDLSAPAEDKPFGGDNIGMYKIRAKQDINKVTIIGKVSKDMMGDMMMDDKVLEGWLVDVDSGYKLSTGQLSKSNLLVFHQRMVNPWIYDVLVITEEPMNDTDPSPNTPIGGAPLAEPFGTQ